MSRRILDETTKSTFASDDYLYMDGQTDGASKITPDNLVRNTTVAQQLAQHIADAEDEVEQITDDIEGIQSDINDVKADIEELQQGGGGLTADIKTALLQIAQKVAYIDEDGQDYYDDLYDALYAITAITLNTNSISMQSIGATSQLAATTTPEGGSVTWSSSNTSVATVSASGLVTSVAYGSATITATAGSLSATCSVVVAQATCTGITATYTQSGTVYDNTSLDDLKTDLVVTASWSNGTTTTLNDSEYTLSGTLSVGTSTVTVAYSSNTATFSVVVSAPWTDGVAYGSDAYTPITENVYLAQGNGQESAYNGWNALNYIDCGGASSLELVKSGSRPDYRYCIFYDENKAFIHDMNSYSAITSDGTTFTIPTNAKYFRLSGESSIMDTFTNGLSTITPYA